MTDAMVLQAKEALKITDGHIGKALYAYVCLRACMCACMRACVRACVRLQQPHEAQDEACKG